MLTVMYGFWVQSMDNKNLRNKICTHKDKAEQTIGKILNVREQGNLYGQPTPEPQEVKG